MASHATVCTASGSMPVTRNPAPENRENRLFPVAMLTVASRCPAAADTAAAAAAVRTASSVNLVHSQRCGVMSWLQASSRVRCSCSRASSGAPRNTPASNGRNVTMMVR
jgi:hypothetical protein